MIKGRVPLDAKYIDTVKSVLENRLHYHLSLASIANSNFDAAELIFSLEGMILLDSNRENFDKDLLDKIFAVVKDRQAISMYWRPLKPFVADEKGLALLPLSVEIAMSLIRTCRLLETKGEKLFSMNYEIFSNYTDWIKARINKCTHEGKEYFGWCSEHIYQSDIIHTWETSQVLVYLANFNDMVQRHIAYQSLTHANFSIKNFIRNKNEWKKFEKSEPLNYEGFKIYEQIGNHFLDKKDFHSMLLYGPPGTGKSTIAEKIAKTNGWPLITITPSDFIASGTEQVEAKAKNIFKVLKEQKNLVVLFDEIDRLILDRDSGYYDKQGDIFQLMTPSMLVKLKDLREKKNIIFIIATNYEERIDKAIKRTGRVDEKYLVLPPDKIRREEIFYEKIDKIIEDEKHEDSIDNDKLKFLEKLKEINTEKLINGTSLYSFIEFTKLLNELFDKLKCVARKTDKGEEFKLIEEGFNSILNDLIKDEPSISLMSYSSKIGIDSEERNLQKPIEEFLSLVFLKAEVETGINKNGINENEFKLILDFFESKEMLNIYYEDSNTSHSDGRTITDRIAKILENRKKFENSIKKYIDDEHMVKTIGEMITKYESRCENE